MAVRNIFVSQQKYFLEYCCTVSVREGRFKKSLMFIVAKEMLCMFSPHCEDRQEAHWP